MNRKLPT